MKCRSRYHLKMHTWEQAAHPDVGRQRRDLVEQRVLSQVAAPGSHASVLRCLLLLIACLRVLLLPARCCLPLALLAAALQLRLGISMAPACRSRVPCAGRAATLPGLAAAMLALLLAGGGSGCGSCNGRSIGGRCSSGARRGSCSGCGRRSWGSSCARRHDVALHKLLQGHELLAPALCQVVLPHLHKKAMKFELKSKLTLRLSKDAGKVVLSHLHKKARQKNRVAVHGNAHSQPQHVSACQATLLDTGMAMQLPSSRTGNCKPAQPLTSHPGKSKMGMQQPPLASTGTVRGPATAMR